ncbi:8339_t:CDS:2, partial [Funneliformis geosporum]
CEALEPIQILDLLELVIKDSTNNETYTEIVTISQPYTPALLKICDEIIVNTYDVSSEKKCLYSRSSFWEFLSKSNIEKGLHNIKENTNGLEAKLANVHFKIFTVETDYANNDHRYRSLAQVLNTLDSYLYGQGCAVAEGDSAITLLQTGLIQTKQLLLAGGLVLTDAELSAYKELSKEVSQLKTGFSEIILVQSEKFRNNKHLLTLTDAYELYFDKKYTTSVEFASLNYEKLLLCVN